MRSIRRSLKKAVLPAALAVFLTVGMSGCATEDGGNPGGEGAGATTQPGAVRRLDRRGVDAALAQVVPFHLDAVIRPNDHIVFVGDEMTGQMFYSRAVATALMTLMPDGGLRFYNGGRDGATAATAINWVDDLLGVSQANVVFVCFGLNEGYGRQPTAQLVAQYKRDLGALVEHIQGRAGVRMVIVVGPPAIQPSLVPVGDSRVPRDISNPTCKDLSAAAAELQAPFVDLFTYTDAVNLEAGKWGAALSVGGNLPNDVAHMLIASCILHALGVQDWSLDATGWPPLAPRRMWSVRWALAVKVHLRADLEKTDACQSLCDQVGAFDELFFKAWRLAGKSPSVPSRESALTTADQAWVKAQKQARILAGVEK